jgi:toxin YoeB
MMKTKYSVALTQKVKKDLIFFQRGQPQNFKTIPKLLHEPADHPREGSGRPKRLGYGLEGKWSRRIDEEHRMVYTIGDDVVRVEVLRMRYYHYQ